MHRKLLILTAMLAILAPATAARAAQVGDPAPVIAFEDAATAAQITSETYAGKVIVFATFWTG